MGCTVYIVEQITIEAASRIAALDLEPHIEVSSNQITIVPSDQFDFKSCQLFGIDGKLLRTTTPTGNGSKLVFSSIPQGVYLLVFQRDGADAMTRKVMVH